MPFATRPCARHRPPVPAPMIMTLRGLLTVPPFGRTPNDWSQISWRSLDPSERRVVLDNVGTRHRFCVFCAGEAALALPKWVQYRGLQLATAEATLTPKGRGVRPSPPCGYQCR